MGEGDARGDAPPPSTRPVPRQEPSTSLHPSPVAALAHPIATRGSFPEHLSLLFAFFRTPHAMPQSTATSQSTKGGSRPYPPPATSAPSQATIAASASAYGAVFF
ncbi:hypothetical protein OF83DRAFT_1179212 [Amylostereum chailletii]|nr:hypothetical protein OF83DRAFT_1179212 [Amylostereum chailletii]